MNDEVQPKTEEVSNTDWYNLARDAVDALKQLDSNPTVSQLPTAAEMRTLYLELGLVPPSHIEPELVVRGGQVYERQYQRNYRTGVLESVLERDDTVDTGRIEIHGTHTIIFEGPVRERKSIAGRREEFYEAHGRVPLNTEVGIPR